MHVHVFTWHLTLFGAGWSTNKHFPYCIFGCRKQWFKKKTTKIQESVGRLPK
jgi:hypothetical protein